MITSQLQPRCVARVGRRQHFLHLHICLNSARSAAIVLLASITLSFVVFILAVRAGTMILSADGSTANPFASYHSMMPGGPEASLDEYNCQRAFDRNSTPPCSIYPDDGSFHLISATTRSGSITEVSFFSQSLQLGDLIHLWGEPDSYHRSGNGRTATLVWEDGIHQYMATLPLKGAEPHVRVVMIRLNCDSTNAGFCDQPS